jgi:hypothetical protein
MRQKEIAVLDTNLFREPVNDDWAGERVTLTFSKFELQAVANALSEVVDVITRDAVYVRHPIMHEVTRAKAAFRAVIGRALLPPNGTGQLTYTPRQSRVCKVYRGRAKTPP